MAGKPAVQQQQRPQYHTAGAGSAGLFLVEQKFGNLRESAVVARGRFGLEATRLPAMQKEQPRRRSAGLRLVVSRQLGGEFESALGWPVGKVAQRPVGRRNMSWAAQKLEYI